MLQGIICLRETAEALVAEGYSTGTRLDKGHEQI
jgi:hypothetical protein